ncbi:MAG: hypothetical protein ACYDCQ_12130 [Dehalococcoidia bacterium]
MANESTQLATSLELVRAAERLARTGKRQVIHLNGAPVAVLAPYLAASDAALQREPAAQHELKRRRKLRGRPLTLNDSIWNIMGIAEAAGPSHVGGHKDEYLAEAYASEIG